jgi:hypothetical protein
MAMERYGTFINVDGESLGALKSAPARYESAVIELLKHISDFKVGWHVLNAIKKTGKQVLIRPTESGGDAAHNNNPIEIQGRLYPVPHRFGDAFVYFNPDHPAKPFIPPAFLRGLPGKAVEALFPYRDDRRWRAEDILVHELFHALRILAIPNLLKLSHTRLPGGFVRVEELYAILVTNMYRSEQKRDHELRGSWSDTFEVLDSNDLKIRLDYGFYLTRLETQMPELTSKLRALPMKFNPFRIQI